MAKDRDADLRGQMLAQQMLLVQLAWMVIEASPHPSTTLARLLKPAEDQLRAMRADTGNDPRSVDAAAATVRGLAELLEAALRKLALERRSTDRRPDA